MSRPTSIALLVGLLVLAAAGVAATVTGILRDTNQVHISTLYRDSPGLSAIDLPNVRVHVATFDADDTSGYNHRRMRPGFTSAECKFGGSEKSPLSIGASRADTSKAGWFRLMSNQIFLHGRDDPMRS